MRSSPAPPAGDDLFCCADLSGEALTGGEGWPRKPDIYKHFRGVGVVIDSSIKNDEDLI